MAKMSKSGIMTQLDILAKLAIIQWLIMGYIGFNVQICDHDQSGNFGQMGHHPLANYGP